jgi:3-hydroxyisobutyrate dehydrogenase
MMTRPARVGVIGIGDMGMPILGSYVRAGHSVAAFDLRGEALRRAEKRGANATKSLAELVEISDLVAVVVLDGDQLHGIIGGENGLLALMRPGTTIVVHTTAMPHIITGLARAAEKAGIALLDCPVTGGTERAERGELTVYVGGHLDALDRVRPVLEALGTVEYVGASGTANVIKLANNLMHLGNKALLYQALELIRAFSIDEARARELWASGSGDSWALRQLDHLDSLLQNHTLAGTDALFNFMTKDLWEAAEVARREGVHLPLVAMVSEYLPSLDRGRIEELKRRKRVIDGGK